MLNIQFPVAEFVFRLETIERCCTVSGNFEKKQISLFQVLKVSFWAGNLDLSLFTGQTSFIIYCKRKILVKLC